MKSSWEGKETKKAPKGAFLLVSVTRVLLIVDCAISVNLC